MSASPLVVVTSPETADAFGDGGSASIAVQQEPRGTGDAVASARAAARRVDGDVLVLSGGHAARHRGAPARARRRTSLGGRRRDGAVVRARRAGAYGRIVRDASGGLCGDRRGSGCFARGAVAHRGEQLPLRLLGRAPVGGARPDRSAQRAGRALPHRLRAPHRRRRGQRPRRRRGELDRRARRQHTCRAGAGRCSAQGSHQRAAHACRRDDRRPCSRRGSRPASRSRPT